MTTTADTYKAEFSIPNYRCSYFERQADDLLTLHCTSSYTSFQYTVYEFEGLSEDEYDYLTDLAYHQNKPEEYHRD